MEILDEQNAYHQFLDDVLCNRQIYVCFTDALDDDDGDTLQTNGNGKYSTVRTIYDWNVRHDT